MAKKGIDSPVTLLTPSCLVNKSFNKVTIIVVSQFSNVRRGQLPHFTLRYVLEELLLFLLVVLASCLLILSYTRVHDVALGDESDLALWIVLSVRVVQYATRRSARSSDDLEACFAWLSKHFFLFFPVEVISFCAILS